MNSRTKGKRGELDARNAVRTLWKSPDCVRAAQVSGTYSQDLLNGPPELHIEVKHYHRIAALNFLRRAEADVQKQRTGAIPVVLMRENGDKEWSILLRMRDSAAFASRIHEATR